MTARTRTLTMPAAILLALASATTAGAQSYLAVSEIVGGGDGPRGEVAIFQLGANGQPVSTTPYATVTGLSNPAGAQLGNPFGLAFDGSHSLYISSLGTDQVLDFNLASSSLSVFRNLHAAGHYNPNGLAIVGGSLYVSAYDGGTSASPGAVLAYSLASNGPGHVNDAPAATYSGNGLIGPTGLHSGSIIDVNSSKTNTLYSIYPLNPPPLQGPSSALSLGANAAGPAGFDFASHYLYETSFTKPSGQSGPGIAVFDANNGNFVGYTPVAGGPADVLPLGGTSTLLASVVGTGEILQYGIGSDGTLSGGSTYLNLGPDAQPTYMTEFSYGGTFHSVPEPSALLLLGLGGLVALGYRRARSRRRSAG